MYKIIFGIIGVALLGIAYYGISPLFRSVRIDEPIPQAKEEAPATFVTKEESVVEERTATKSPEGKEPLAPKIVTAPVVGTKGHPAGGTARIINTENGSVMRYENFKTLNGPDLFVYLAKDLKAKEFVSLGELKATEGNVNYEVPANVDANDYQYVMVWCRQFGVLFNYADLSVIH